MIQIPNHEDKELLGCFRKKYTVKQANLHDSRKFTLDAKLVNFNSFMITWEGVDHFKKG